MKGQSKLLGVSCQSQENILVESVVTPKKKKKYFYGSLQKAWIDQIYVDAVTLI